jgi:hypothetical protein
MPGIDAYGSLPRPVREGYHSSRSDIASGQGLKPPSLLQHEMPPMSQMGQKQRSVARNGGNCVSNGPKADLI